MCEEEIRMPWDQLPNEPLTSYRRFLVYRNLGPGRSLDRAYEAIKGSKKQPSGYFAKISGKFDWERRATAWDIENMADQGARTAVNFVKTLEILAAKAILDAMKPEREIRNVDQLLDVLNVIGNFITPEVIEASRRLVSGDFGRDQENG